MSRATTAEPAELDLFKAADARATATTPVGARRGEPHPTQDPSRDPAPAASVLQPETTPTAIVRVLTARMEILLDHTYRFAPPVVELEAARTAFTAYDGEPWRTTGHQERIERDTSPLPGWLPPPPDDDDEAGWRGWCLMIEGYQRLAEALLPPGHPEAHHHRHRIDPRPPAVPPTEAWLLAAARARVDRLRHETCARYHRHPWFLRDRDTPTPLLRVRARLATHRTAENKRPWDLDNDPMEELDAVLVRRAPDWWYRLRADRGATPLHLVDEMRSAWRARIDAPPDSTLYAPTP